MMISGSSLVLFLFLVPMGVFCIDKTECGENIEFTPPSCNDTLTCDPNHKIMTVGLTINGMGNKLLMEINVTDKEPHCSDNGTFCVKVSEDRKQMNLTVNGATFRHQGQYTVNIVRDDLKVQQQTFIIHVKGVCEPKLSSSTDKLTCEVDVESTSKPTIVWMDEHRKIYQEKTFPESVTEKVTKLQDSFNLKDETRKVAMCCTVSYKEGKLKEKRICQILPSHVAGSDEANDAANNKNTIVISILCVVGLAFGIALYTLRRRPISFTKKNRERTFSEVGLIGDHQAENMEGAPSEPLQRPQDQV